MRRVFRAFHFSIKGLRAAFRKEAAFRQELLLVLLALPLALWLGDSGVERALMAGSAMLVLIVELLNTGIENVVDRIGPERHKLSGRAKDMGSAAVFVALVNAALVWGLVLAG